jgi:hypothetical protein
MGNMIKSSDVGQWGGVEGFQFVDAINQHFAHRCGGDKHARAEEAFAQEVFLSIV